MGRSPFWKSWLAAFPLHLLRRCKGELNPIALFLPGKIKHGKQRKHLGNKLQGRFLKKPPLPLGVTND
jgi:hypothetical protein